MRYLDLAAKLLIPYSVLMYFVEVQLNGLDTPSSGYFLWSERAVALLFTIEYFIRWFYQKHYTKSLNSVIDLLGFIPFWIGFFVPIEHLKWVRAIRVVRLLKFHKYNSALSHFGRAVHKIRDELSVLGFVSLLVVVFGSIVMYEVEHSAQDTKFTSIFDSVWWCIVTLATIGYGDIYPITPLGKVFAAIIIIFGVGIFGTFISLMGNGLIQVYREDRIVREEAEKLLGEVDEHS